MIRSIVPPLVCLLAAGGASGQVQSSMDDEMRARLIGVLDQTRLSVEFDGIPARAAFRSISAALATTIIVRYAEDGSGIDPEAPVTLQVVESPARLVLESVVEQCALYQPCTWQLRTGYIEVGTKERLGVPGAAETRLYNLRDLMLEAPYFGGGGMAGMFGMRGIGGRTSVDNNEGFKNHPYACAALTTKVGGAARKRPEELIDEIAEGIIEMIEPGNWDYGQEDEQGDDPRLARGGHVTGPWQADAASKGEKIARIRVINDRLVIVAPDYIHRQINGYPKPIPPGPLSEDECRERSSKASVDGARVVVHAIQAGAASRERRR